jgi:hemoglobin
VVRDLWPCCRADHLGRFYQDVAQDGLLGPVFEDVAGVDWAEHLPKITAFWCRMLLGERGEGAYDGNPLAAHRRIHEREPFTPAMFVRWLELFHETLDEGWTGPRVDHAKRLAAQVARVHGGQLAGAPAVTIGLQVSSRPR